MKGINKKLQMLEIIIFNSSNIMLHCLDIA